MENQIESPAIDLKERYAVLKKMTNEEIVSKLEEQGIQGADKLDDDDFRLLKSGLQNHTVLTNRYTDVENPEIMAACDTSLCKVKFRYVEEKGQFYVNKKFAQKELSIPNTYLGVEISAKMKEELTKYNSCGVHKITDSKGNVVKGFISLDKDLKSLMFVGTSKSFIPDILGNGNVLTEKMKDSLRNGYVVKFKNYTNKSGEVKDMNLKLSPFIAGKMTFPMGPKIEEKVGNDISNEVKEEIKKEAKKTRGVKI